MPWEHPHPDGSTSGPSLDLIQQFHILFVLGAPDLNTILQVGAHKNNKLQCIFYLTTLCLEDIHIFLIDFCAILEKKILQNTKYCRFKYLEKLLCF